MASVSSTSSANQYGLQQLSVLQAKRTADQAEQTAQSLKVQASAAQRVADQAQENARSLGVQSEQAQAKAGQARQGVAALNSAQQGISQLSTVVDQVLDRDKTSVSAVSTTPQAASATPAPVVNTQGQVTGTIINTTA